MQFIFTDPFQKFLFRFLTIHEPYKAPSPDKFKILGYPKPIVDHSVVRKEALVRYEILVQLQMNRNFVLLGSNSQWKTRYELFHIEQIQIIHHHLIHIKGEQAIKTKPDKTSTVCPDKCKF